LHYYTVYNHFNMHKELFYFDFENGLMCYNCYRLWYNMHVIKTHKAIQYE